jgi:RNA polymerase sigma-70 factor, ECF subfamily
MDESRARRERVNPAGAVEDLKMTPTNGTGTRDRWATFERSRRRLGNIAARILGSPEDAEDLVQETALRWLQTDPSTVRAPEGWLVAVVTRLAVDRLRRTLTERQAYREVRHWTESASPDWSVPDRPLELASHVSKAFLLLRERLEPTERAAFVLREMFDCGYDEIARLLAKSEVACRQIVHRARLRLRRLQPRRTPGGAEPSRLNDRFLHAVAAGDREAVLAALLAPTPDRPRRTRRAARVLPWRRAPAAATSQTSWGRILPSSPAA